MWSANDTDDTEDTDDTDGTDLGCYVISALQ